MDARTLKEITSELNLLYVEDDVVLREETYRLFTHLFKNTDTAENGKVALEKIKTEDYDLIITDINMPIMDGVTLSKEIRKINPNLPIVVTSAHDESNYLLDLIDIGIDKFILKPLEVQKFLYALSIVCTNIRNKKLVKRYKEEIEETNLRLSQSNEELEVLVKILDNKITQLNINNKIIQKVPQQSPKNAINMISNDPPKEIKKLVDKGDDLYVYNDYLHPDDLQILHDTEKEIDSIFILLKSQEDITHEGVLQLAKVLAEYTNILHNYNFFKALTQEIDNLAKIISQESESFIKVKSDIMILLESFIYVFKKWRIALFEKGIKDPYIYDASMINDIKIIVSLLQGNKKPRSFDALV